MVLQFFTRISPDLFPVLQEDPMLLSEQIIAATVDIVQKKLESRELNKDDPNVFTLLEELVADMLAEKFDVPHCKMESKFASSTLMVIDVLPKETVQKAPSGLLH